ncbi:hypothetical protein Acr_10g0008730 [Actinidia rufa]|uniref:Uncharacterized protein n=1 Tax=Actinidia rufa TaxID=165716 RepID=A0A7J0F9X1_9ERIC|nr:hypothetical protein Acr_10g0008730 [Actinidia rufa]
MDDDLPDCIPPAFLWLDNFFVCFVPLQLSLSLHELDQCLPRSCELDVLASAALDTCTQLPLCFAHQPCYLLMQNVADERDSLSSRLFDSPLRVPHAIFGIAVTTSREKNKEHRCRSTVPLIFLPPTTLILPPHVGGTSLSNTARLTFTRRDALGPVLTICFYFQSMALNRAQLLVHDDEALARFCVDHRIPNDILIERPGPKRWTLIGLERTPETQMLEGNHYLRLRKPNQPQTRIQCSFLEEERSVLSRNQRSEQLRAYPQGPEAKEFTFTGGEEAEVEDGEEVDSSPNRSPFGFSPLGRLLSTSTLAAAAHPLVLKGTKKLWLPKVRILEKGQAPRNEPTTLSKDHETCITLGNAVMLPQDVTDHAAAETTAEFRSKLVMMGAQRVVSTSLRLKQSAVDLKKANQKANSLEKETKLQRETSDLKAFACGEVYKKLFDRAFERAEDVYERQLAKLCPDLPASPERYSPIIILPDFNEEEHATTLPANEGDVNIAVAEVRTGIEEMVKGGLSCWVEGDRDGEAESENLIKEQFF